MSINTFPLVSPCIREVHGLSSGQRIHSAAVTIFAGDSGSPGDKGWVEKTIRWSEGTSPLSTANGVPLFEIYVPEQRETQQSRQVFPDIGLAWLRQ